MDQRITETMGLDVGDRKSHYFVVSNETGEVVSEGSVASERTAIERILGGAPTTRVVLEAGTHSPWMATAIREAGHEPVVVLPHRARLITQNHRKSDRVDAELLARLGRLGDDLLATVKHRRPNTLNHLALVRSREQLVRSRAGLVQHCRGIVKSSGARLPRCSTDAFAKKVRAYIPGELAPALHPVLASIETLSAQIKKMDREVEELSRRSYLETALLRQVPGVGPITALAYVLTIENPKRFERSRDVGPYLGLTPRRDQSGDVDKQLRITKAGDRMLRSLLVQAAHYVMGPFGPDSTLRRWALERLERGGKAMKKRTVVAVARKLAVLLHALWRRGESYEPLRGITPSTTN